MPLKSRKIHGLVVCVLHYVISVFNDKFFHDHTFFYVPFCYQKLFSSLFVYEIISKSQTIGEYFIPDFVFYPSYARNDGPLLMIKSLNSYPYDAFMRIMKLRSYSLGQTSVFPYVFCAFDVLIPPLSDDISKHTGRRKDSNTVKRRK